MSLDTELRAVGPSSISAARALAHKAVQLLTKAARANLEAKPDDSHSNLGWDSPSKSFSTHPLPTGNGTVVAQLSMSPLRIELVRDGRTIVARPLVDETYQATGEWLDAQLSKIGLHPATDINLSYELPAEASAIEKFEANKLRSELDALSAWFDLASLTLKQFADDNSEFNTGPVRCWPHHFDIATYVQLEDGDFESAKGVGVGMSPGDEAYDQPYFYINPWPHMKPENLLDAPSPGHWHTEGFVGAIASGDEALSAASVETSLQSFVQASFDIGRKQLGA